MFKSLYRSVIVTLFLGFILCFAYPFAVFVIGNIFFSDGVRGGIIELNGKSVGAKLIGQKFSRPEYLHGRPSAAGEKGYDAANSSGSNLGPTNQKFYEALKENVNNFLIENPTVSKGDIPVNSITASGSGLDPHISPDSALIQIARIAKVRKVNADQLRSFIQNHVEGPQLGIFGEPVVNVLSVNIDLDKNFPMRN